MFQEAPKVQRISNLADTEIMARWYFVQIQVSEVCKRIPANRVILQSLQLRTNNLKHVSTAS